MLSRTLLLSPVGGEGNGGAKAADQSDILALNDQLKADITKARSDLSVSQSEVTRLKTENDQLKADKTKLETEKTDAVKLAAEANKNLTSMTAERDDWKAKAAPVQQQLSAELVKHGIRKESLQQPNQDGVKLTLTEQCRAAKAGATK